MQTITLFDYIQSELIKNGFNEFVDQDGKLVFFEDDSQFMTKIFKYDNDISDIINKIFNGLNLNEEDHDTHFKKTFVYRFLNREINRQTIEAFKMELANVFLTNELFINTVYEDLEKYMKQENISTNENIQENNQTSDQTNLSDTRNAFADLPQSNINLDVDDTVLRSATDLTITRGKQTNQNETVGETKNDSLSQSKQFNVDELIKTSQVMENVFNEFDRKCFMQFW